MNFAEEDPVEVIRALTGGIGTDRVIDAVGIDAEAPAGQERPQEVDAIAPNRNPSGDNWHPGTAPSQALDWAIQAAAKAGTIGIIGVYPPQAHSFPIGMAMNRNVTVNMGNCNHRRIIPHLVEMVRADRMNPIDILSDVVPVSDAISAYETFDTRTPGWTKVELVPGM